MLEQLTGASRGLNLGEWALNGVTIHAEEVIEVGSVNVLCLNEWWASVSRKLGTQSVFPNMKVSLYASGL
jgi:hypothetical protein